MCEEQEKYIILILLIGSYGIALSPNPSNDYTTAAPTYAEVFQIIPSSLPSYNKTINQKNQLPGNNPNQEYDDRPNDLSIFLEDADITPVNIINLTVDCLDNAMKVHIQFDNEFNGLVYSKGFLTKNCLYVYPQQRKRSYDFIVPTKSCGTVSGNIKESNRNEVFYYENTLVFQYDPLFSLISDYARNIRCKWNSRIDATVTFAPFS